MSTTKKHDYTALDALLIEQITNRAPMLFQTLVYSPLVRDESERLAAAEFEKAEAWRIIDRRLQALRKAGKVKYQRKPEGWVRA